MNLLGKSWVILSPALLWYPSDFQVGVHIKGSLICLPEDTGWQQGDRGESEESWRCLSLPFPEALLEAIITLFSRWEISFSPSFRIAVTIFYTYPCFLQFQVLLLWVYHNPKFKNDDLGFPCSHYMCILSTEKEFWCKQAIVEDK